MRITMRSRLTLLLLTFVLLLAAPAMALADATLDTSADLSTSAGTPTNVQIGSNAFKIKIWATTGNVPTSKDGKAYVGTSYSMATNGTITADQNATQLAQFDPGYNYSNCPQTNAPKGCPTNPFEVAATLNVAQGTPDGRTGTLTVYNSAASGSGLSADTSPAGGQVKVVVPQPTKQDQTITFNTIPNKTYGDANFAVSATASSGLSVTYQASGTCSVSGNTVTITGAGNCDVTASQAGNDSYNPAPNVIRGFTIAPKAVTGGFTASNKTYDGNNAAEVTGRSLSGVVGQDQVSLSGGTASFADKNVGTDKTVTLSGASLDGTAKNNYTLASISNTTANITKKSLAGNFTASNKTYDGNDSATITGGSLVAGDLISGDSVNLDRSGATAKFADKNFGTDKTVTATGGFGLSGTDANNYSLSMNATKANIDKKNLTVDGALANNKTYDGTRAATVGFSGASPAGKVGTENVTIDSSGYAAEFDSKDFGTDKPVTVTGVNLGGSDAGNYSVSQPSGLKANITKKSLTGSFAAQNKVYDGDTSANATAQPLQGVVNGDTVDLNVSDAQFDTKNVGDDKNVNANLSLSGAQAANYSVNASHTAKANITAKDITGSFTASDKTYDGTTNASIIGRSLQGVISADENAVSLSGGSASFNDKDAGEGKTVTGTGFGLSGAAMGNYNLISGTLTTTANISTAPLTVKADDKSREYGQDNPNFSASYSGFVPGEGAGVLGGTLDFVTNATVTSPAGGDYHIRPSGLTSGNYNIAFADGKLTIDKARAEIGLSGLSHTYDATAKAATVQITPEPAAKSATRRALTVTYDGQSSQPSNAGSYAVVASLDDDNYIADDARGTLTIAKADLTVKANNASRVYGDDNPTFGGSLLGVKNGDNITASYSSNATSSSPVGTYAITAQLSDPNGKLSNYTVTNDSGTLTVSKAALSVEAKDATKVYGDGNPQFDGTLTGVKNNDDITASYSSAAGPGSDVGTHNIVPSINATDAVLANYEQPTLTNGKLTITKAPLTIQADNATRKYDEADPAFTGSIVSGTIKNNDAVSLAFSTQATRISNVGTYAIVPSLSGVKASNYGVTAQNGTLTITKATATINLSDLSHTYDGTAKSATVTTNPDVPNRQITIEYDGDQQAPTNAGSYSVVASLNDANYEADDARGTLVIGKAQAAININEASLSKTYNGSPQGVSAGTTPAGLGGVSVTYDGQSSEPTNAGSYAVVAKLDNRNYGAESVTRQLVIAKANPQIAWSNPQAITYGMPLDAAQLNASADVRGNLEYTPAAGRVLDAGTHTLSVAFTPDDTTNYNSNSKEVQITVNKAALSVNADNATKYFGDPDPALTYKLSGFANGENENTAGVSGNADCRLNSSASTNVGNYSEAITCGSGSLSAQNYSFAPGAKGTLRIQAWTTKGFYSPVDMGIWNTVKAGSTVPMKFEVFKGSTELKSLSDIKSASHSKVNCGALDTTAADAIELTTTGSTSLRFDATSDQFIFNWKTGSTWTAGTCYVVTVVTQDGTPLNAYFKMK